MIILKESQVFNELEFKLEQELEDTIVEHHPLIFGKDTIFINAKKLIGSETLGKTVPDGFLFNMSDPENREFYLVEVELERHDFYNHIFPQITKFFAFYRDGVRQKELVEKLFTTINKDKPLQRQFKKYLGEVEIFKFLSDVIDNSQNILILIDGEKPELPEIKDTYSDTWGKMVKVMTLKRYIQQNKANDIIFTVHPEFESIELSYEETPSEIEKKGTTYTEEYHSEGVSENVKNIYQKIKTDILDFDSNLIFNPQKYYISIKGNRNIAFLKFRKKKISIVVMLPEEVIQTLVKNHSVKSLSEPVQKFYNGKCAAIYVSEIKFIEEVIKVLKEAINADRVED